MSESILKLSNLVDENKINMVRTFATEGYAPDEGLDVPAESMQIALVTDKLIEKSNLIPVTDPISFMRGDIPTEGGLFSTTIFGSTAEEQKRIFSYIDLGEKFFHPYIYEILCSLIPKKFARCCAGDGSWGFDKDGYLIEISKDDPSYNENNTGIRWMVKNFRKMNYKQSNAIVRKDRIKLIESLSDDEIFITKWLVIPKFYRDLDKNTSARKLPEIDDWYNNVIRYSRSLRDSTFDFFNNQIRFNLQKELVAIRRYGQMLLEKKHGFFHKAILGKSTDRGSRDVISVANMNNFQRPEDNPVDIFHTGIPLSKCLIVGYDFIMRYCLEFFADNFRNVKEYPVYSIKDGEYIVTESVKLKDQVQKFNTKFIDKKINRFKNSHATRYELITLTAEDGREIPVHMAGQFAHMSDSNPLSSTILNRPMTWTDLFYQAAINTLSDKYVYITRYPITSHNSIYPSICRPLATIKTLPAFIDGQFYEYYPVIDLNMPSDKISSQFNDTVTMSNMYLQALGADFDGDTTSTKLCFTLEANKEAEEILKSVRSYVGPDGALIRVLGNEAYLTFYNMTRQEASGGILSNELKAELLKLKRDQLTLNSIAKLFGYTTKSTPNLKERKASAFEIDPPKFDPRAKFTLNKGEYTNKEQVNTSVGIFLFNKLLVEGNLENVVPNGYYNEVCNKKKFSKLTDMVATSLLSGDIKVEPNIATFLNAYEFWGLGLVTIFSPSYSMETIIPNKALEEKKKELLKNAPDNDLATLVKIEDTLVETASKMLTGTAGKNLFDSGARGSFENDFKNMAINIGAVMNPATKTYDYMSSNYMEGIKKEDLPAAANSILNAEYPKAVGTAQGGYMTKQFYSVFQSIILDEDGTDCGTTQGLLVTLTKENLNNFVDQYLIDGKNLILITNELDSKYMNHPVKIRSSMYCINEKICSKCAGKRFYKVDMMNLGLTTPSISGKLQNASLKLRHSLKIKMNSVDENSLLL